jgi:diguanylate cyclase (GGDEF)-like protein
MVTSIPGDELFAFADEDEAPAVQHGPVWRVLIVDDEHDVHQVTVMAMKSVNVEGRTLEFLHAYSAAQARTLLAQHDDLAVVLLDVVMESENAGLALVRHIREELGNRALRIILRTGQPGYAPQIDTIRNYDINDYKTKSELTRVMLYATLSVAIRSYWQIHQLEANRRGLELIVAAATELSKTRGLQRFAQGVVTQLCVLLGVAEEGLVCAATQEGGAAPYVLAAAGRFSPWIGQPLTAVPDERVRTGLLCSFETRGNCLSETTCLFFSVPGDVALAAFVDVDHALGEIDSKLLEVFCGNIATAFANTQLLQRVSALAYEDPLLGLPNRNAFLAGLDRHAQHARHGVRLALVDLDGFADINSILDQDFGDAVLRVVAQRMRQSFSPEVVVARVGSDVFGLLGASDELTASRIGQVFAEPFVVGNENLRLSATSGLVDLDDDARRGVELLKNAGLALKKAKSVKRGQALFFEKGHAVAARQRMHMLSRLRLAFAAQRLSLVYQPFVELASGRIVGAEALLRWRGDDGAYIAPDRFIPLAEQSGLMLPIGDWVVHGALAFLKRLAGRVAPDFRMAINVSHTQFREPDFVARLLAAVAEHAVDAANVELELTESVVIDNLAAINEKLRAIRAAGMAIAIDDFGTGYSSLSLLRQLAVDRIKIDRAFVSGEDSQVGGYRIAEMVIRLADQLGLATIAEGIETAAQGETLCRLGCRDGQGYFYARPLAEDDFVALLGVNA